jgi:hypothetical protein
MTAVGVSIVCLAACVVASCDNRGGGGGIGVQRDTAVKFQSRIGNVIIAPSQWTAEDKGSTFTLRSPDGHALIHILTFTAEGSGTVEEFRELMAARLLPAGADWAPSGWSTLTLAGEAAYRRDLVPVPNAGDRAWRLYVLRAGKMYHAIVLNASTPAMKLNGGYYETDLIASFSPIRE